MKKVLLVYVDQSLKSVARMAFVIAIVLSDESKERISHDFDPSQSCNSTGQVFQSFDFDLDSFSRSIPFFCSLLNRTGNAGPSNASPGFASGPKSRAL